MHGTVTIFVPYLILSTNIQFLTTELGIIRLLGVIPILLGALILLWSIRHLTVVGKGTPAPFDPPKELVVRSLYRFVRNPMYIGDLLVLLGESLVFESAILLIYALVILCVCHLFVVMHEEPTLKRKFGESYERYCKAVPRWIPALRSGKENVQGSESR